MYIICIYNVMYMLCICYVYVMYMLCICYVYVYILCIYNVMYTNRKCQRTHFLSTYKFANLELKLSNAEYLKS